MKMLQIGRTNQHISADYLSSHLMLECPVVIRAEKHTFQILQAELVDSELRNPQSCFTEQTCRHHRCDSQFCLPK